MFPADCRAVPAGGRPHRCLGWRCRTKSIRGCGDRALVLRRVETMLLTCCLGQAFPSKKWVAGSSRMFWRHSLGCHGMRNSSEKLGAADARKSPPWLGCCATPGFMVNCLVSRANSPRRWTVLQENCAGRGGTPHHGIHPLRDRAGAGGTLETGGRCRRGDRASSCRRGESQKSQPLVALVPP